MIEDGKSRASYEYNASMTEQTGDRIVITPERLRHFALYDNTSISRESWFKSDHIKFNQAYYAGMEEQHHAFDIGERQIQKREGMIYDSPVYDKDSYYLADLAELSSAVRQMDAYFNYRQGEKLSGRFPEAEHKYVDVGIQRTVEIEAPKLPLSPRDSIKRDSSIKR